MAVNDPTTNYLWDLPIDGGSLDIWGSETNESIGEELVANILGVDGVLGTLQTALDLLEANILLAEERVTALKSASGEPVYVRTSKPNALDPIVHALTQVLWPATDFEEGGTFYSAVNAELLTVPSDGGYNIVAQITVPIFKGKGDGDDDGIAWELSVHKNAATTPLGVSRIPFRTNGMSAVSGNQVLRVAVMDDGATGDTYEVRVLRSTVTQKRTKTALIQSDTDHFSIHKLPSPVDVPLATMQWANPMVVGRWARLADAAVATKAAGVATPTLSDGKIHYRPFGVNRKVVLDQAGFNLGFSFTGSNNVRIGIYDTALLDGLPRTLIGQTLDIAMVNPSAGAFSNFFTTAVTLEPNKLYWAAVVQYIVSGSGAVRILSYGLDDPGVYGAHLGWDGSTAALVGTTETDCMLLATPSPLISGALPTAADLTALSWDINGWPVPAFRIDELPTD